MRNITEDQCNSTEEVCGLFRSIFTNQEQMEAKIVQNAQEIEALKPKKGKSKMKSKGSVLTRTLASIMLIAVIAGLCYAAYVPTDITYEISSNPEMLSIYLRDVLGNMASDSYLFNPRIAENPPPFGEGRVWYNTGTHSLMVDNGADPAAWMQIGVAGGVNLDGAYDFGGAGLGRTIIATDGAVLIQNTEADAVPLLHLSYTGAAQTGEGLTVTMAGGSGHAIEIENTGTGKDFEGTDGDFTVDKDGNVVCIDLTTSGDVLLTGANYNVSFDEDREMLLFEDDAILGFGGATDGTADMTFTFESAGSSLDIAGDDLEILIGTAGAGLNVIFSSEEVAEYATFAEEAAELLLTHYDIQLDDDSELIIGTGNDWVIKDDTGDTLEILTKLTNGTASINLGVDGAGADLLMFSEVNGNYIMFNSSEDEMQFEDCDLKLNEFAQIEFVHNDNNNDWTIDLATANILLFTCAETNETPGVQIGVASAGADLKVFGTDATDWIEWDASADLFTIVGDAVAWTLTEAAATAVNIDITGAAGGFDLDTTDGNIALTTGGATRTLQLHSDAGTTQDSIYFLSDVGGITSTASAVPDGRYGHLISGSISTATRSEGLGLYVEGNTSGHADGKVYALGAWLNITNGTPTDVPDSLMAAADFGVYAAAAPTLSTTQVRVINLEYQVHASAPPQEGVMMHFNCDAAQDVPDYWFSTGNAQAVAYEANATEGSPNKVGAIKIEIGGVGAMYLWTYSDAGS